MDERDEKALDNFVESIEGQIDMNGVLMQAVMNAPGDAKLLQPLLFTMGHAIVELRRQVGRLDSRITALETRNT
jgi:hypothetical protein